MGVGSDELPEKRRSGALEWQQLHCPTLRRVFLVLAGIKALALLAALLRPQGLSAHVVLKCLKVCISLLEGTVADDDDDDQPPGGKSCVGLPSIWSTASTASDLTGSLTGGGVEGRSGGATGEAFAVGIRRHCLDQVQRFSEYDGERVGAIATAAAAAAAAATMFAARPCWNWNDKFQCTEGPTKHNCNSDATALKASLRQISPLPSVAVRCCYRRRRGHAQARRTRSGASDRTR